MKSQTRSCSLYLAAFSINFSVLATGSCYSWTSPFLPKFQSNDPSINPISRPITTSEAGLLVSLISLGLLIGPLFPPLVTDRLGKRKTLLLSVIPLVVAHIMCFAATTIELFFVARFLMGLTTGAIWGMIPAYIGEISEPTNRGMLGSLIAVMTSTGSVFANCTGPFLSMKWFSVANLSIVIIFYILVFIFVPESPYDLIGKIELRKAEQTLIRLRQRADVQGELAEIKKSIETDNSGSGKFADLFKSTGLIRAMIVSTIVMILSPLTAICSLLGYTQTIFDAAQMTLSSEYAVIIVGVVGILVTIVHAYLVDRLGRKILLIISFIILFISFATLGAYFYLQENDYNISALSWLPVCSLMIYMIGYYLGAGAIPYVMVGELFPSNIKATATGFFTSLNFTLTFFITLAFPYLIELIGMEYTFWLFGLCMAIGAIFCLLFVPETKDKSLQEIYMMLCSDKKG